MKFGVLFSEGVDGHDESYNVEAHVLQSMDVRVAEVCLEAAIDGDPEEALAHLPRGGTTWLYRGWLLSEEDYTALCDAVADRGDRLVVHPTEYAAAAFLPNWVDVLGHRTPATIWTEDTDAQEAWDEAIEVLGPPPWIIKDHLKSARDDWKTACFVPEGADFERFRDICQGLIDARGHLFERGLVVRRYVNLKRLPFVSRGAPVCDEHRVFFWRGKAIAHAPYHDLEVPPLTTIPFPELGDLVDSPFFTADFGRLEDGSWTVIELNDGGGSGRPEHLDPWQLYEAIVASYG